jgi:hypothetical protein
VKLATIDAGGGAAGASARVAAGIALVAAALGGRHSRLAAIAVAVGAICFVAGMVVAVVTKNPLY